MSKLGLILLAGTLLWCVAFGLGTVALEILAGILAIVAAGLALLFGVAGARWALAGPEEPSRASTRRWALFHAAVCAAACAIIGACWIDSGTPVFAVYVPFLAWWAWWALRVLRAAFNPRPAPPAAGNS